MRSSAYALMAAVAISLPGVAAGQGFQYANPWTVGHYYSAGGYPPGMPAGYGYGEASPGYPVQAAPSTYVPNGSYQGSPEGTYYPPPADYGLAAPAAPCHGAGYGHCGPSRDGVLHRSGIFAEYLYWQVSDADLPFAVAQDGIGSVGTIPLLEVTTLDPDHESAFRTGFNVALDCQSSISASYTKFETSTEAFANVLPPFVIQPLVTLPATFNAGSTGQSAHGVFSLDFETIDLEYRAVLLSCSKYYINGMIGGRYATLDQDFGSVFFFAPPDGTTAVASSIDFDGAGIRTGLEGERRLGLGIFSYGKLIGSLVAGDFRSDFLQLNQFNGAEGVTGMRESRIVPMLETELGLGWSNHQGNFRVSAGYYFSIWSNMITTQEWIDALQTTSLESPGRDARDDIRFDGLVVHAELRL